MPNSWTPNSQYRIGLNAEFSNPERDLMPKSRMPNSPVPNWTECRIFECRMGLNAEISNAVLDWRPNVTECRMFEYRTRLNAEFPNTELDCRSSPTRRTHTQAGLYLYVKRRKAKIEEESQYRYVSWRGREGIGANSNEGGHEADINLSTVMLFCMSVYFAAAVSQNSACVTQQMCRIVTLFHNFSIMKDGS